MVTIDLWQWHCQNRRKFIYLFIFFCGNGIVEIEGKKNCGNGFVAMAFTKQKRKKIVAIDLPKIRGERELSE